MAVVEHCNLRLPDAVSVISTNWDNCAKFEVAEPVCCCLIVFYCDNFCYAMTFTFDTLTLNICSVSAVSGESVPDFSEIEQSGAELLRFQYVT